MVISSFVFTHVWRDSESSLRVESHFEVKNFFPRVLCLKRFSIKQKEKSQKNWKNSNFAKLNISVDYKRFCMKNKNLKLTQIIKRWYVTGIFFGEMLTNFKTYLKMIEFSKSWLITKHLINRSWTKFNESVVIYNRKL